MEIKRRTFLKGCLSTLAWASLDTLVFGKVSNENQFYVNAIADEQGNYFLQVFEPSGKVVWQLPLPERGHAFAYHVHTRQLVVFARRPGTYAIIVDLKTPYQSLKIEAPQGHHFYGHGIFTQDGRWLLTTENNYDSGDGVIGIFDAKSGYQRVSEFPAYGIGPHEIQLLSDGKTLVVANGGIRTHPDYGRQKLNLSTMKSSLAYIDLSSKKLSGIFHLPLEYQKMSIRHLIVTVEDKVALAMQYQGARAHRYPLVGIHQGDDAIQLLQAPPSILRQMRNYCGSVVADAAGTMLGVSSPRGNVITFWSIQEREYLGHVFVEDGCGIAPTLSAGEFIISSGNGSLFRSSMTSSNTFHLQLLQQHPVRWDNHMLGKL